MTAEERAEVLVTARLLRAARILAWLAAALTVVAAASFPMGGNKGASAVALAAGLIAVYYGIRVAFDAALLEDIAAGRLSTPDLDRALGRESRADRTWRARCRGARRLVVWCAAATIAEVAAIIAIGVVRS